MNLDPSRRLKADVVISVTPKGDRVGVYYADTDGSTVLAELAPDAARMLVKQHNAHINRLR